MSPSRRSKTPRNRCSSSSRSYGAPFEAIGLLAFIVHINWNDLSDPAVANGKTAVERVLHGVGRPMLFVDLDAVDLLRKGKSYSIAEDRLVPREQYRALVYLDESEALEYAR